MHIIIKNLFAHLYYVPLELIFTIIKNNDEENNRFKKELNENVRSELEKIRGDLVKEEEDSVDSTFSESTFGSSRQPKAKKRVSLFIFLY